MSSSKVSASLVVVAVLAGLLWRELAAPPRVDSFTAGATTCDYDLDTREVVFDVRLALATHGHVDVTVRTEVFDRTDPDRQPYVSTRMVAFDTDGRREEQTFQLRISQTRGEWLAGRDRCVVTYDTVPS